jgi:hypothetical protein
MADKRVGDCNIEIATNRPENCESNSSEERNLFKRLNKIPTLKLVLGKFLRNAWKLGKDDPRRVIHAIKVGLALSVVSLFYLMEPLFDGVGNNAIWAIMTVVVVFEFTAGATLSKGLNRGIGTVLAGSLGVSVGCIADMAGGIGEPIIIGTSCFILGTSATYFRFFPKIKRKYDYGVVIFILTFNMITVSGYRIDNIVRMAYERLSTIAIGSAICLVISLFVSPIWAGEDLHKSIIKRIQCLADSIEVCVLEYFKGSDVLEDGSAEILEAQICQGYKDVLDSKASEDSLSTFASWEPRHGKFRFNHPWKQYVRVGSMIRHLAYCVVALHGCLRSEIQAPHLNRAALKKPCTNVGAEVAEVLRQLAESISCMKQCPPSESLMKSVHDAVQELNTSFNLQPKLFQVIQPLYRPHKNHSAAETLRVNSDTSQIKAGPDHLIIHRDHQIIHILKDTEHNYTCEEDKHKSSSQVSSPRAKDHFDSPTIVSDVASERNYISSTSGGRYISKGTYAETLPLAAFASLLVEIVARLEHVIEAVQELGKLAAFQP